MTTPHLADVAVVTTGPAAGTDHTSYVDWPAIIAGIVLAAAISLVLLTFGSAIGLSFADFDARDGADPLWIAIAAASWLLWVQISSFMSGAYLTGRLRKRHHDATEDEADIRDGAHGLLVWAGALIVGAWIAVNGIGAAANAVGSAAATLTTAASNVAGDAAGAALDPNAYFVDQLFRPAATGTAPAAEAPATDAAAAPATDAAAAPATDAAAPATPAPAASTATTPTVDTEAARAEAGRIFAQGALAGEVSAEDRTYLAQSISQSTGMTPEEATARVDQVMTAMDTAAAEAAEAAEAARKTGVIAAFLAAASLLVSAAGAFWAAQKGGNHRDNNTAFPGVFRRF